MIDAVPIDIPALIKTCAPNVGYDTMKAIIRVETNFRPHAIGYKIVHGKVVTALKKQPANKEQAVAWAQWMLKNGYKFDAGIAQINSINFAAYGLDAQNVFDPCTNIRAGAAILTEAYRRASKRYGEGHAALHAAISAYNSGNFETGFRNGYVKQVVSAAGVNIPTSVPPLGAAIRTAFSGALSQEKYNPMTAGSRVLFQVGDSGWGR